MKKNYLKPEAAVVSVVVKNFILSASGDNIPVVPDEEGDEFANKHRGEWGNVWAN